MKDEERLTIKRSPAFYSELTSIILAAFRLILLATEVNKESQKAKGKRQK